MAIKLKDPAPAPASTPAIVMVEVSALKEYENNPRKNDHAVPRMVELIKSFGFRQPILVRGDRIVDGHLRIKAARAMGLAAVPAIDVSDLSEAQERALRIAMNKSVEWATWDEDLLSKEMKAIMAEKLDLSLTGFEANEIGRLIKDLAAPAPAPKVTKTKLADAGLPADPEHVSVTFHMADKSRTKLLAALEAFREANTLTNHSQAVLALAVKWAEENGFSLPK